MLQRFVNRLKKWPLPLGIGEGILLKLNIAQKQITWFVQNNKDKNSFLIRVRFCLLPVVTSEGLNLRLVVLHKNQELVLYKSTKCWVLPVKTYLTAPYLVKGVSKKLNFGFTFDLSHSLVYGGQNQNWIINKNRIALLKNRFFKNFFWKRLIFAPIFLRKGWGAFLKGGDAHRNKSTTE